MNLNLLLEASLTTIFQGFKKDSKDHADTNPMYFKKYRIVNVNKLDKRSNNIPLDGYSLVYDDITKQIVIIGKVSSSDSRSTNGFYKPIISFTTSNIKKKEDINYKNLFTKEESHVTCTCDSFKYQMSKGNKDRKSLYVGKYNNNDELNYPVVNKNWSPNPQKKGLLCKHLLVLLKDIQSNWESWKVKIDSLLEKENFFTVNKDPIVVPKDDYDEYEDDDAFDKDIYKDDIKKYSKDDDSINKNNDYALDNSSDNKKSIDTEPTPKKKENIIKRVYRSAKDKLSKAKSKIGKFFSKDEEQPKSSSVNLNPEENPEELKNIPIDSEEEPEEELKEPDELLEEGINGFDSYFSKYSLLEINKKSVDEIVKEFINYKKGI